MPFSPFAKGAGGLGRFLDLKDFNRRRRNFQKSYQGFSIAGFLAVEKPEALSFRKFDNSFIVVKFPLKNSMLITFRF